MLRPCALSPSTSAPSAPSPWFCWPGVARRPVTFFCFAKRKSPKVTQWGFAHFAKRSYANTKRRPAVWVPSLRYGQPAVLDYGGVSRKLASLRQARSLIRLRLRSSAQPGRGNRERGQIPTRTRLGESLFLQVFGVLSSAVGYLAVRYSGAPCGCAEERRARRIRAKTCLSEASCF